MPTRSEVSRPAHPDRNPRGYNTLNVDAVVEFNNRGLKEPHATIAPPKPLIQTERGVDPTRMPDPYTTTRDPFGRTPNR